MTSWLAANWRHVALGLLILATVSGWLSRARWVGIADAHEAEAEVERLRGDSIEALRLTERRADSIRTAALRDSADARVARAEEARRREAADRERAERARARALESAADLRQTLTPAQVPLFEAYEADRDMEVAAVESELESVSTRADEAETEVASLWDAMRAKDRLYEIAVDELASKDAQIASLEAANEALRRAARAGGIFDFDLGRDPWLVGAGIAIGWAVSR